MLSLNKITLRFTLEVLPIRIFIMGHVQTMWTNLQGRTIYVYLAKHSAYIMLTLVYYE